MSVSVNMYPSDKIGCLNEFYFLNILFYFYFILKKLFVAFFTSILCKLNLNR